MRTDFVIPSNNEADFVSLGFKLGFKKLIFCYNYDRKISRDFLLQKIELAKSISEKKKLRMNFGFAIIVKDKKDIQKARKIVNTVIFNSNSSVDIRSIVDKHKPSFILNLEFQKYDFVHHRNSGINQIIGKSLTQNHVGVCLSLPLLFSTKYKAEVLGRMIQNISLSKKFGFEIKMFSFAKTPYDMKSIKNMESFGLTLGANPSQRNQLFEN